MSNVVEISKPISGQLVDAKAVATHFSFDATFVRKLARTGMIPCYVVKFGKKNYYRFRINEVEERLHRGHTPQGVVPAREHSKGPAA